ncbi:uncharacterized protein LOC122576263 [Bombus pyrosoma]|uniref:uncharacterized protein LOC122576263 n=1 Tax=Bombus pyrosoma TaxID=396416 RepID=UPI001CB95BA6|nr:uncharacterized protein LOC122576263 [Bombus pyrosoma]XP_043602245.1 uncharacterized protein LOC122576263 [Bombus pyrosoma]XP_043602246.1 uncharacterized protein LOC122576263 [Bombus pyrosoma]XP_043602247.1 uncharacterized protein LOC122576263 [Bombus pyrosoma]XP_043602248.1 uncharacterized protein LOC122576263 [Bombus pyrosoma]XP_043602249.1 uncharacterized protein LOC122576263 [Bombus pyrosoma]
MIRTSKKQKNKKERKEEVTRGREEEELAPESVQAGVKHTTRLQTRKTTDEEEWSPVRSPEASELAQKPRKVPFKYLIADVIERAAEVFMGVETCNDLDETEAEAFSKKAITIIMGTIDIVVKSLPIISIERRLEEMGMDSKTRCLCGIEQKLETVGSTLTRGLNEYFKDSNVEWEKVVSSVLNKKWTGTEVSDPQVPMEVPGEGKAAAAMDWQTVGEKAAGKKNKKRTEERQSKKITPEIEEKSSRKAPERRSENRERRNKKATLPRQPRTSAVSITIKKGAAKSYAEVLATARDNIHLTEVGIERLNMRKAMTEGVILKVPKDQKREKAAALAARLTKVLDPNVIRVAAPYRTAEIRVLYIDISATADEIRNSLAQKGECKAEDIQLGEICISKNGLASVCARCPVGAVRKLVQAGKVVIGWSVPKIEAIGQRPFQCFRCLEIGHLKKSCTSKVDRENLCYRCGVSGHRAKECIAANPKCPLCEALGAPAAHRMGGWSCVPLRKRTREATRGPVTARELTDGSAVKKGNKKKGSPQGIPASTPANKELGVEEAIKALHLGD